MPLDTALALIGFAFVMSISPGPGNFLLLSSGANFGFVRTLPLVLGIAFGFLAMVAGVGLGLGQVFQAYPAVGIALRVVCGLYVCWLALRIARSRGLGAGEAQSLERPFSFLQAAMLQLVNPKAWTVALLVTVSYVDPAAPIASLAVLIAIFAAVCIPLIGVWAVSGSALRRFLAAGNRITLFNLAMVALLVVSMVPVIVSSAR